MSTNKKAIVIGYNEEPYSCVYYTLLAIENMFI